VKPKLAASTPIIRIAIQEDLHGLVLLCDLRAADLAHDPEGGRGSAAR